MEKVLKKYWIQMKLNEQLLRMRQMFSSINENKFEKPEYIKFDYNDIDIEVVEKGAYDALIDLHLITDADNYKSFRLEIDFDYEKGEPQTYDYPGSPDSVDNVYIQKGFELDENGEEGKELTKFELDSLYHDGEIRRRIDDVVDEIFRDNMEDGYYDNDDYDRDDDW